jgi:hypothetical protein
MFSGTDHKLQNSASKFPVKKQGKFDGTEETAY